MNIAEKMERESRLMGNIADWMEKHGEVLSDRQRSNAYTGVRIREIRWRGRDYQIVDVDGMTCPGSRKCNSIQREEADGGCG